MLTCLLSLLLTFISAVLTFGSECHAAKATFPTAAEGWDSQARLHDSADYQSARTPPPPDDSRQESENKCNNYPTKSELFGSVSEKFESSFSESIVLHLVAKTTGKLLPLDLLHKNPRTPSLVRLSVMLQV